MITSKQSKISQRDVLHVQCMSHWAPMCIGPYSQANIFYDSLILIAGQIPLDPASMTVWKPKELDNGSALEYRGMITRQLILCMRHVHRILQSLKASIKDGLSCIVYINANHFIDINLSVDFTWLEIAIQKLIHYGIFDPIFQNESIDTNAKSAMFNRDIHNIYQDVFSDSEASDSEEGNNHSFNSEDKLPWIPVLLVVVPNLPRNAPIEIEFIAMKSVKHNEAIASSSSLITYNNEGSVDDCKFVDLREFSTTKYELQSSFKQWPFWDGSEIRRLYESKMSLEEPSRAVNDIQISWDQTEDEDFLSLNYHSMVRIREQCLCSGYIEISADSIADTIEGRIYLLVIAKIIVLQIKKGMNRAIMSIGSSLKYIRIYFPVSIFSDDNMNMMQLFLRYFLDDEFLSTDKGIGIASSSLAIIPIGVSGLRHGGIIVSVHYLSIDGLQIQTENWIHSESS